MPSKTPKQRRFMAGCANNPEQMTNCPPQEVAKEFANADRVRKNDRRRGKNSTRGK